RLAMEALAARGEATGAELAKADPRLATRILMAPGTRFEGEVSVASRVLTLLSMEGRVVRGRPRGTWVSSQYRWSPAERWLAGGLPRLTTEQAQADLVRRWLRAFGPGPARDIRWWTGLSASEVGRALR